ncbi:hypothetical protein [uncultured Pseudokineococcus sp.]|uniref:hypothetical protein n=1 Tax=uncultured Pseudokineococcus sp. TaxID=1642928 RepID=UPI0026089B1C|nr:hypothetical protein [uncultured Pseudokineococcus sp.]
MVVGVVLLSLLGATAVALWCPAAWSVGAVLAAGVAWWLVNGPVEGAVLVELAPGRGVTVADLLVPPLAAVAAAAWLRARRRAAAHGLGRPAGAGRPSR